MNFLGWLCLTVLWIAVLALLGRIMSRDPPERQTGVFYGDGSILPHRALPWVTVGARVARRLRAGDRVEFEIAPRTGEARRIRVYRRAE
jgi:hypothetical protein